MREIKSSPLLLVFIVTSAFGAIIGLMMGVIVSPEMKIILTLAAVSALSTGIVFSLLVGIAIYLNSKKVQELALNPQDIEVFGKANHKFQNIYRGGHLYLTKNELVFHPGRINLHKDVLTIPFGSIKSVKGFNFYFLIPTGIVVESKDGEREMLAVNDRTSWLNEIQRLMGTK